MVNIINSEYQCKVIVSNIFAGCEEGDVKVVNGLDNEGTVLMCLDGLWTMISESGWDTQEAQVACRTLGYPTNGILL